MLASHLLEQCTKRFVPCLFVSKPFPAILNRIIGRATAFDGQRKHIPDANVATGHRAAGGTANEGYRDNEASSAPLGNLRFEGLDLSGLGPWQRAYPFN
jgi:hypothetical protein